MASRLVTKWGARVLVPVLLAACEGTPVEPVSAIAGIWDFTAVRSYTAAGTCADTGSMDIHAQGGSFTGRRERVGACTGFSYQQTDSITAGIISGQTVTFTIVAIPGGAVLCSATATVIPIFPDSLDGHAICGGEQVTFSAVRQRTLASLALTPAGFQRVVGSTTAMATVLHAANGARVFRPLTWSSDSVLIAAVAPDGLVLAVGPGSATITARAGDLSGSAVVTVLAPSRLTTVAAGDARTCALSALGDALCWGLALGGGVPTPISGGVHFVNLSMGHDFACGVVTGGAAYCFGSNDSGQLGNGTTISSPVPVLVSGGLNFRMVSGGGRHACGVTTTGEAWCWGANWGGQLGNGTTTSSSVPVPVSGGISFFTVTGGGGHTCAVRGVDSLSFCWGDNSYGQLGDSTTTRRLTPVRVGYAGTLVPMSAGDRHTCGPAISRVLYCWGNNGSGQLGTGNAQDAHHPVPVSGGQQFFQVSAGSIHTCAMALPTAAIWCWGNNSWGQLGNGTTTSSNVPVQVSGGLAYASLSVGMYSYSDEAVNAATAAHSCAVSTGPNGVTYCWGVNNLGQVGSGAPSFIAQTVPGKVAGQP